MKRIASLAALAVLMAGSCPGQSPAAPAERSPLRVLSIGNSFSASLFWLVATDRFAPFSFTFSSSSDLSSSASSCPCFTRLL